MSRQRTLADDPQPLSWRAARDQFEVLARGIRRAPDKERDVESRLREAARVVEQRYIDSQPFKNAILDINSKEGEEPWEGFYEEQERAREDLGKLRRAFERLIPLHRKQSDLGQPPPPELVATNDTRKAEREKRLKAARKRWSVTTEELPFAWIHSVAGVDHKDAYDWKTGKLPDTSRMSNEIEEILLKPKPPKKPPKIEIL